MSAPLATCLEPRGASLRGIVGADNWVPTASSASLIGAGLRRPPNTNSRNNDHGGNRNRDVDEATERARQPHSCRHEQGEQQQPASDAATLRRGVRWPGCR